MSYYDSNSNSISRLVPLAKNGDGAAHNEICKQVQSYLHVMADRQLDAGLRRKMNPSDIVQMAMTRMYNGLNDFRGQSRPEFYAWLNQILRNEINTTRRDLRRAKRDVGREKEITEEDGNYGGPMMTDPNLTPSSQAIQAEKLRQFNTALQTLPPDYATVIQLRSLDELPFKEVAVKMNKSYDAVTKLWYRAIVKLQDELDRMNDSVMCNAIA